MAMTYREWKARAEEAAYPNRKTEKEFLKAGERRMREHTAPIVRQFNNSLQELHNQVHDTVEDAVEAAAEARKALRAASRRDLSVKETRQARDRLWRAELNVERQIDEYNKSLAFAMTARDDPIAFVDKLAEKYDLELDLPH